MLQLQPLVLPRLHPPLVFGDEEPSAFVRGEHERQLRLVVDDLGLTSSPALDAIMALATHPSLELTTTSNHGPSVIKLERGGVRDDYMPVLITRDDGRTSHRAVWPASTWLHFAREHARKTGENVDEAESRHLLAAAVESNTDALVVRNTRFGAAGDRANPLIPRQAAALLGLFLRSRGLQDERVVGRDRSSIPIDFQRFLVTRHALDAGWRWFSACGASARDTGRIAEGVHTRVERALRARDEVMIQCLSETRRPAREGDVLYHLDAMLLWLGGAFDTAALIASRACGISLSDHLVGWRRPQWRATLQMHAPELIRMTDAGAPLRAVLDLVAAFRNTIHGRPLSGVTFSSSRDNERSLIELPPTVEAEASTACEALGGRDLWGFVHEGVDPLGGLWDPYRVVQVLLPFCVAGLNALMAATPVERLPGVDPNRLMSGPPANFFVDQDERRRLMCLHGLDDRVT